MSLKLYIREQLKMLLQHTYMPLVYKLASRGRIQKGLVVFADSHSDKLPFSMKKMYAEVKATGRYDVRVRCRDFDKLSKLSLIGWLTDFMKLYARAEYVFICDNFLPVSSCKKREETTVVQLWHSGGLLKKSGYDQPYSVPKYYKGNVFANYDLLTVSADCCVPVFTRMMRQPEGVVQATGISRSDMYYSKRFIDNCKREFYEAYPEALGKQIVLYAPTFRGSAAEPRMAGMEDIDAVFEGQEEFFLVKKLHPHFERKHSEAQSCEIPTERLLPVADLMITDFSSVLFDFLKSPLSYSHPTMTNTQKRSASTLMCMTSPPPSQKRGTSLNRRSFTSLSGATDERLRDLKTSIWALVTAKPPNE